MPKKIDPKVKKRCVGWCWGACAVPLAHGGLEALEVALVPLDAHHSLTITHSRRAATAYSPSARTSRTGYG